MKCQVNMAPGGLVPLSSYTLLEATMKDNNCPVRDPASHLALYKGGNIYFF